MQLMRAICAPLAASAMCVLLAGAAATWTVAAAADAVPSTPAAVDLGKLPSAGTAHGDRKLLLQIASAGSALLAVGEGGLVMRSTDAGTAWTQIPTPTSVMLTALTFADTQHGWAVGHDGIILATEDGGLTWLRQFDGNGSNEQMLAAATRQQASVNAKAGESPAIQRARELAEDRLADAEAATKAGPTRPFLGVVFADAQTGWAVGSFGQLFETRDAGHHWLYVGDRLENPEGLHLNAIVRASNGDLLIAAEAGRVFRSRDGGRQWTVTDLGYAGHIYGLVPMPGGNSVVAYGFRGHVFRSDDGGGTWAAVKTPLEKTLVAGVAVDAEHLWLLAQDGRLLRSSDGGRSFVLSPTRMPGSNASNFMIVNGALLAVGARGVEHQAMPAESKP